MHDFQYFFVTVVNYGCKVSIIMDFNVLAMYDTGAVFTTIHFLYNLRMGAIR
jgi:hypothetical protein